jgi:N-acetylglucosaminyl-diphospho-decaprenol L-rhamnosyltransferase
MKLLTVIVNYCTAQHVLNALERLVPQLEAVGDSAVWVVDNKSPDDSLVILSQALATRGYGERVRLIASPHNGGFGAGNNRAIREALALKNPPEYVYLLNPDATPEPGAIAALVAFLDREPRAAIAGTAIQDPDGTPHASAFSFPTLLGEFENSVAFGPLARILRDRRFLPDVMTESGPVHWVSGASMVMRREVLERIGLFDEQFFLYFEEVDLCQRAHRAGYQTWFVREAKVSHIGSVVTGVTAERRRPRYWFDSRARYWRKHHGTAGLWLSNLLCLGGTASFRTRRFLMGQELGGQPHFVKDFIRYNLFPRARS